MLLEGANCVRLGPHLTVIWANRGDHVLETDRCYLPFLEAMKSTAVIFLKCTPSPRPQYIPKRSVCR